MHVCSHIIKVVSTKSIVTISSKDRDTPASIRAITRESQTHDVDVCGAGKAYNMVAKRVSNNQFRDAKLNKRSTTVLCLIEAGCPDLSMR